MAEKKNVQQVGHVLFLSEGPRSRGARNKKALKQADSRFLLEWKGPGRASKVLARSQAKSQAEDFPAGNQGSVFFFAVDSLPPAGDFSRVKAAPAERP